MALFILCDRSFVFFDVMAEISAQVMVRRQTTMSLCSIGLVVGIGPVVGIDLPVGSTLVVSPNMSRSTTKQTKWPVLPVKTQINQGTRPVWSEYSQCAQWVAEDLVFPHVDREDSDQTGQMSRLIWVFGGRSFFESWNYFLSLFSHF